MASLRQGSFRLFRLAGVDLFLHWSWFLVAAFEISDRAKSYSSLSWNVLEYLALFLIVLLHEYGHALACRQVGGTANQIVLWPLVNVALLIVLSVLSTLNRSLGWAETMPNAHALLRSVWLINLVLLIFNLLPIYPLDGGQILRSLLWFAVGRARSLMVTTIIGFVGVAGFIILALRMQSVWFGVLSVFILTSCWRGLRQAQALSRILESPRRDGFTCPSCTAAPPVGNFWMCGQCRKRFDTFQTQAICPNCATQFAVTACLDCGRQRPMSEWIVSAPPQPLMS